MSKRRRISSSACKQSSSASSREVPRLPDDVLGHLIENFLDDDEPDLLYRLCCCTRSHFLPGVAPRIARFLQEQLLPHIAQFETGVDLRQSLSQWTHHAVYTTGGGCYELSPYLAPLYVKALLAYCARLNQHFWQPLHYFIATARAGSFTTPAEARRFFAALRLFRLETQCLYPALYSTEQDTIIARPAEPHTRLCHVYCRPEGRAAALVQPLVWDGGDAAEKRVIRTIAEPMDSEAECDRLFARLLETKKEDPYAQELLTAYYEEAKAAPQSRWKGRAATFLCCHSILTLREPRQRRDSFCEVVVQQQQQQQQRDTYFQYIGSKAQRPLLARCFTCYGGLDEARMAHSLERRRLQNRATVLSWIPPDDATNSEDQVVREDEKYIFL
jgi:hypothetical protein